MNIDRSLVARAFSKAGEEPITDDEWTEGTSNRVRVVKDFYLATILESLASYDWTSQKKRAALEIIDSETEENLTNYLFMYALPADCAKVVCLKDGKDYIIEGGFLYTNSENAVCVYIKNYFTGKRVYQQVENPVEADIDKYYYLDDGEYIKALVWDSEETYYTLVEEDYNYYAQPQFDPPLASYIECKLAASIALKLTGDANKYQILYNEAILIANNAQKKSAEMAQNKTKGNKWWIEELGME